MKKAFFATVIMIFMFCTLTMSANARARATYDATIKAHCNTESRDIVVSLTKDRSSSGQTPQTFTSLTGSHTFTVPSTDTNGHSFTQWSNGATSTTITVTSAGTYTANYQASTSYKHTYTVTTLAELTSVISKVAPGDTVLIRGGIYQPTSPITFRISGTSGSPITYEAYPNEKVIFDGSLTTDASLGGDGSWEPPMIYVYKGCNWNIFRNIEIRYSAGSGITMWGDDNVLDHVETHHNKGTGANTYGDRCKFLYCIAHDNIDTQHSPPGQDADGLSASEDGDDVNYVASGCYFLGCLCYGNSDDGIDCLGSTGNTIEKCVCHHNGLLQGDGRGFVLATGGSNHASKCIAYNNAKFGFSDDDTPAPNNIIDHCTAYNNGKAGFLSNMKSIDIGTFTNNIGTLVVYDAVPIQHYNTWNLGITNYGFVSTDSTSVDFLSLLVNSLCRSKASDASDLGALQYGERISDLSIGDIYNGPVTPVTPPAKLFTGGFESGDFSAWYGTWIGATGTATVVTSPFYSGKYAAKFSVAAADGSRCNKILGAAYPHLFVRGYFNFATLNCDANGGVTILMAVADATDTNGFMYVTLFYDTSIGLYRLSIAGGGGTPYRQSAGIAFSTNKWYCIEAEAQNGLLNLWLDGVNVLSYSGDAIPTNGQMVQVGLVWSWGTTNILYIDDVAVGTVYNGPIATPPVTPPAQLKTEEELV